MLHKYWKLAFVPGAVEKGPLQPGRGLPLNVVDGYGQFELKVTHPHQAAQDAHTHGSAEAYDPPIVWANRARPMPWEKADPDRVPEVGLLGKREGVLWG